LLGSCLVEDLIEGKGKSMSISDIHERFFTIYVDGIKRVELLSQQSIQEAADQLSTLGLIKRSGRDIEGLTKKGKVIASAIFSPITSLGRVLGFLIFLMFTLFVYFFIPSLFFVATGSILGYALLFTIILVAIGVVYIGCFLIPAFLSLKLRKHRIDKAVKT